MWESGNCLKRISRETVCATLVPSADLASVAQCIEEIIRDRHLAVGCRHESEDLAKRIGLITLRVSHKGQQIPKRAS